MKEYCVDLELAKELKENGFPQKSEYSWSLYIDWVEDNSNGIASKKQIESWDLVKGRLMSKKDEYSAPITEEILKELPAFIKKEDLILQLVIRKNEVGFIVSYGDSFATHAEYLHNALANLWIYLKQKRVINEI